MWAGVIQLFSGVFIVLSGHTNSHMSGQVIMEGIKGTKGIVYS